MREWEDLGCAAYESQVCQQLPYELNSEELICTILQKGHGHDTDEWRDYDEDNVPFERLEKVYVPDEDSLEQRMNIFHDQLYSLYSQSEK